MPDTDLDFEEAFRVIKIDDTHYRGAHPLRLPIAGARGVYGGHICAQTLLVAMESAPGYIVHSIHSYFIAPPTNLKVCDYEVINLQEGKNFAKRMVKCLQYLASKKTSKIMYTCTVSLVKRGYKKDVGKKSLEFQVPRPPLQEKYKNPDELTVNHHTSFVKNAYSREFTNFEECPQETSQAPSKRWITVFSGLDQPKPVKDPKFNYVGLACISDSALLTTLARVLHLPWNPTELYNTEDFDESKDALELMQISMNIIQIHHYTAMSLDHHIYFHCDNESAFDVVKDWLAFHYQMKVLSNNRILVRGGLFNPDGVQVATVFQEGFGIIHPDLSEQLKL